MSIIHESVDFPFTLNKNGAVKGGTWKKIENHTIYANWLYEKMGYTHQDDWYKLTTSIIYNNKGRDLINKYYHGSHIKFLQTIFPEYEWLEWKFNRVPNGFWRNIENHKKYANYLGQILKYTKMEDWYNIIGDDISNNNGCGLSHYYDDSPIKFLRAVFPEYTWLEWKFITVSMGFWEK